ncbi:MAG: PAS domain S-box protein, partial [Arenimonas sp.]
MDSLVLPLRILLVDDSATDIALNIRALNDLGRPIVTEAVSSDSGLRETLSRFKPDLILSDFSMPGFSGQKALEIANELAPDIPFIYVSGTIGEELAIEAMQRGASDYVLKDNLRRLKPAIERALIAAEQRLERQRMQLALRDSEERFRAIVETTEDWIWEMDIDGHHIYSNDSVISMLGYSPAELMEKNSLELLVDEDRKLVEAKLPELIATKQGWNNWVLHWRHRDGSIRLLESKAQPLFDANGNMSGYRGIDRDVTLRMQQASKIEQLARIQAVLSAHGNSVLRARDANELLDLTCRVAVEQGHFKAALISQRMPGNLLTISNSYGDEAVIGMLTALGPVPLEASGEQVRPSARVFLQAKRINIPDFAKSDLPDFLRDGASQAGVAAQIVLPIGSPPWAILNLFSGTAQEYDNEEIALLERLTAEIDYGHDFIAKSERLEYLAYHNAVTGLPSRTSFGELIGPRLERSPHVVVMMDIDRFRYYNNSRSRGFGDSLLRAVSSRLITLMPEETLFTHPGDDAFLFAYPSIEDIEASMSRVEAILKNCCEQSFIVDGE